MPRAPALVAAACALAIACSTYATEDRAPGSDGGGVDASTDAPPLDAASATPEVDAGRPDGSVALDGGCVERLAETFVDLPDFGRPPWDLPAEPFALVDGAIRFERVFAASSSALEDRYLQLALGSGCARTLAIELQYSATTRFTLLRFFAEGGSSFALDVEDGKLAPGGNTLPAGPSQRLVVRWTDEGAMSIETAGETRTVGAAGSARADRVRLGIMRPPTASTGEAKLNIHSLVLE